MIKKILSGDLFLWLGKTDNILTLCLVIGIGLILIGNKYSVETAYRKMEKMRNEVEILKEIHLDLSIERAKNLRFTEIEKRAKKLGLSLRNNIRKME